MLSRRTLLALAAALATGCSGTADFTITKEFSNVTPVNGAIPAVTQHVDLSKEAGSAWRHRSKLKSLDLVGLDATVTRVSSADTITASGTLTLIRDGTRVAVGTWTDEHFNAAPHSVNVVFDKAGTALLNEAIHGDGQLDAEFAGSVAGAPTGYNFDATIALHVAAKFRVP